MKIVKEETFGPITAIIKFKDKAKVMEMVNNTTYGLTAHIFTQNVNRSVKYVQVHLQDAGNLLLDHDIIISISLLKELQDTNIPAIP